MQHLMDSICPLWFVLKILREDFLICLMTDRKREILLDQETEVENTSKIAEYAKQGVSIWLSWKMQPVQGTMLNRGDTFLRQIMLSDKQMGNKCFCEIYKIVEMAYYDIW